MALVCGRIGPVLDNLVESGHLGLEIVHNGLVVGLDGIELLLGLGPDGIELLLGLGFLLSGGLGLGPDGIELLLFLPPI